MRWDALFADLEARWAGESSVELERDIAEATRFEQGAVGLSDRLRAQIGDPLLLMLPGGYSVNVELKAVGPDWLAGADGHQGVVVPLSALQSVSGLGRRAQQERSAVRQRLGLSSVLRSMMRDRAVVEIRGSSAEVIVHGLLVGVGSDHLEVARTVSGEVPRLRGTRGVRVVPFFAVCEVRAYGDLVS